MEGMAQDLFRHIHCKGGRSWQNLTNSCWNPLCYICWKASEDDLGFKQGLKSLKLFVVKIAKLELFEAVPEKGQQINITLTEMLTV